MVYDKTHPNEPRLSAEGTIVTPTDRKKISERVAQLLTPYGIAVRHTERRGFYIAGFTFRIPDAPRDKSRPGKYSELSMQLAPHDLNQYHTSAECLDKRPLFWAGRIADHAPNLFDAAPLPTAAEIDWRPTEAIPEGFGAA
jgi:hypothetical protein